MTIDFPNEKDFDSQCALWKEAFGDSAEFINTFKRTAYSLKRSRVVKDGENVIGALYWFDCFDKEKKIAYIYAVATKKEYRGKGICKALMDDTHKLLKNFKYDGAILVPGSKSLSEFYAKIGYQTATYIREFSCSRSNDKININEISKKDFAVLRRKYLPKNGLIQENENLDFLESFTSFFKGDDFLMVARKENDTLSCSEILGNTENAESIVNSFNCEKGIFRTIGNEKPFSMYISFKPDSEYKPNYFGFAFD